MVKRLLSKDPHSPSDSSPSMGSASGGFNKRNKNNKAIPPEKAVRMVLPIEGEMPKGRGGLYFMKKEYINPEMYIAMMETELPMALSYVDEEADPDETVHGKRRRGQWGNLWYEGEEE